MDRRDRGSRAGHGGELRRDEPHLHDGQLGCPWLVQADPPAGGHARPDGQPEGRDHRAPDQGQLHGGPDRARVLHLDPRRPQGPRRHGAAHRGLRLPDAPSGRRRPGRDHPRAGLRHRRVHHAADPQRPGRPNDNLVGRIAAEPVATKRGRAIVEKGGEIDRAELVEIIEAEGNLKGGERDRRSARRSSAMPRSACARRATGARWPRASSPRSATRSASSPRSRSASRARS